MAKTAEDTTSILPVSSADPISILMIGKVEEGRRRKFTLPGHTQQCFLVGLCESPGSEGMCIVKFEDNTTAKASREDIYRAAGISLLKMQTPRRVSIQAHLN